MIKPRMSKKEFTTQVFTDSLLDEFLEEYPEYKDKTKQQLTKYWKNITNKIKTNVVCNPLGLKLPNYMGELKCQYLPHKFKAKDYKTSEELGEDVNYVNLVTKGKVATIKWERRWAVRYNKILQFYAYLECQDWCHLAKDHITNHPEMVLTSRNTLGGHSIWRQYEQIKQTGNRGSQSST